MEAVQPLRLIDVPETVQRKPKPPRERDAIWDEMEAIFGAAPGGTNAHARRNKAVKDLRLMEATPDELRRAVLSFNAAFPRACCTDIALATHFPQFRPKRLTAPCQECGVGGGYHAADCVVVGGRQH